MKPITAFFEIIVLMVALSSNCNQINNRQADRAEVPLQGTKWNLFSLMGVNVTVADSLGKQASIIFNKDGTVTGNGGCNNFSGNYELNDSSQIKFSPIISTKMYCPNAKEEVLYFDLLSRTDNFLIKADTLYLRNRTMDSTAKFIVAPPAKTPI